MWKSVGRFCTTVCRFSCLLISGIACFVFFRIMNKTVIIGRGNFPHHKNVMIISNHQSWIDSWLIGYAAFLPWMYLKFSLAPWHMADRQNFFMSSKKMALLSWLSQCLPVDRGSRPETKDLRTVICKLRKGTLMIFPEGGRTRAETRKERGYLQDQWDRGAAYLACQTQATVVPIAIRGMSEIWPVEQKYPNWWGHQIVVEIGKPVKLDQYWKQCDGGTCGRDVECAVSNKIKTALVSTLKAATLKFFQVTKAY